jgi:DNA-binding NtrC family response regulator
MYKKRVITVVDEPRVRKFLEAVFHREGFLVSPAAPCVDPICPEDCNLNCCTPEDTPDLAVFEVIVPRSCCGIEAAHKALQRWPGVKILLTSASSSDAWPGDAASLLNALPADACAFLKKPFTLGQLRESVQSLFREVPAAVRG